MSDINISFNTKKLITNIKQSSTFECADKVSADSGQENNHYLQ